MTETTSLSVTHSVRERVKRCAEFKDETYSSILDRIMDVYERTQWSPARIEAANDPEDSGAEHVIALALEVIRDEIPDADSYICTGIPTEDGEHE